ncbi:MAG: hypothetical protein JNM36_05925 [Chitinophagales bacterium]|jgi:hypothetical protein|nr:hypothetical protein [Chitinophagales bacterium]
MNKIKFRAVRDVGSTIDVTIQFLRQNFSIISRSIFFIAIPFLLVGALLYSGIYIIQNSFSTESDVIYFLGVFITVMLIILYFFSIFPIIYEYMYLYQKSEDFRQITVSAVRKRVASRILSYIGNAFLIFFLSITVYVFGSLVTGLLMAIDIAVGAFGVFLFLCLLAYVSIAFSLIYAINLFEDVSFGIALNRSFYLLKGHFFTTFGLYITAFFISLSVTIIPSSSLPVLVEFLGTTFGINYSEVVVILLGFLYSFILLVVISVTLTASLFRYFSLVEGKEAMGAQEAIEQIGVGR